MENHWSETAKKLLTEAGISRDEWGNVFTEMRNLAGTELLQKGPVEKMRFDHDQEGLTITFCGGRVLKLRSDHDRDESWINFDFEDMDLLKYLPTAVANSQKERAERINKSMMAMSLTVDTDKT